MHRDKRQRPVNTIQSLSSMSPTMPFTSETSTFVAPRPTRVLSNSAAEFVELRAGPEICRRATGELEKRSDREQRLEAALAGVKYNSQLDCFMPESDVPDEASYYRESGEMLEKFQETLKSFSQILQSRSIFKKLDIEARDPANFDLDYVLKIAAKIQEHKDGSEDTQTIKRFARKCFRGATQNKTAITALLSMVPNDIYGSVISGGFSLILAAVENHENNRAEIQSALADIPRKLEAIQRSFEMRIRWPILHRCADQILLSIFVVLERIIDKLSMSTLQKGVYKMKGRGSDIKEAIDALGERIKDFQDKANTCSQIMLGRTHDGVQDILAILGKTDHRVQSFQTQLGQGQEAIASKLDEVLANQVGTSVAQRDSIRELVAPILNTLYAMFAADKLFNAADGTLNRREIEPASAAPPKRAGSGVLFSLDKRKELVDTWLSALGDFDPSPEPHIKSHLSSFPRMSPDEMDRAQWIMSSGKLNLWLTPTSSRVLDLHSETAPDSLTNPLSFASASLAFSFAQATNFPVLSFFCGLQPKQPPGPATNRTMTLWNSLNAQLLTFIIAHRQTTDLSFLEQPKFLRKSQSKPKYATLLFKELLSSLPDNEMIFIIIDSFSRFGATAADFVEGNKLLEELVRLTKEMPQLVVKLLVTDALTSSKIRTLAELTIRVPDDVGGWRGGVSVRDLEEKRGVMVGQLVKRRKRIESDGVEEGSEGGSGSE